MPRFVNRRFVLLVVTALGLAAFQMSDTQAHKAVTSPYTFNKEIFPILRDRCGSCHVPGGAGPMSLMVYRDDNSPGDGAMPWAESIRELLVDEQMPPWYVDPMGPAVKGGHHLSPLEANQLITWAAGGTPIGDLDKKLPKVVANNQWKGGPPDLKLTMEADSTLAAASAEETKEFVLATGLTDVKWVKAVDLLPGTPSIVRNALITVDNGPVLAVWVPGEDVIPAPSGAAFKLAAGSKLRLQIHYKKQWNQEGKAITDKSTVGLYFTDPPATGRELQALTIDGPSSGESPTHLTFGGTLTSAGRIVAVRPSLDQVYGDVQVSAVTPTGTRVALLKLRMPRPEWRRRYWLAEPVELPAGSKIEVTSSMPPDFIDLSPARLVKGYPLQVALDYVPQQ